MSPEANHIPQRSLWLWILSLSVLAVGARNFEAGLSTDSPLYAAIARNIAQTGEWFFLYGGTPDFKPFTEHPHLGFWLMGLIFKILPAADWSARILGHLCYIVFLFFYFRFIEALFNQKVATWSVLLLWVWPAFGNWFSNAYLDPPTLVFGFGALYCLQRSFEKNSLSLAFLCGSLFAFCLMTKGLTIAGFFPPVLYLFGVALLKKTSNKKTIAKITILATLGLCLISLAYYWSVQQSTVPDFFTRYWSRQVTQRFGTSLGLEGVFRIEFWLQLFKDTHYLAILGLLGIFIALKNRHSYSQKPIWLPLCLLISFVVLYSSKGRIGGQYWVMILPWLAIYIALAITSKVNISALSIRLWSQRFSLAAVLVIQYLPFRTHTFQLNDLLKETRQLSDSKKYTFVYMDTPNMYPDFLAASPLSWYGNVDVQFHYRPLPVPQAQKHALFLLIPPEAARSTELKNKDWCFHDKFKDAELWKGCAND